MSAIAKTVARALPSRIRPFKSAFLNELVLFAGPGFLALLLFITQDLDIGTRFF